MTTATSPEGTAAPTTRIVIVSGNEYQVPVTATEAELRSHLSSMFPDIATATLTKGKRTVEGVTYETWEFVKKAGTKGASGGDLAGLLLHTLPLPTAPLSPRALALIGRWRDTRRTHHYYGERDQSKLLTIEEALAGDLSGVLSILPTFGTTNSGGSLCALLDTLPAVPGSDTSGW